MKTVWAAQSHPLLQVWLCITSQLLAQMKNGHHAWPKAGLFTRSVTVMPVICRAWQGVERYCCTVFWVANLPNWAEIIPFGQRKCWGMNNVRFQNHLSSGLSTLRPPSLLLFSPANTGSLTFYCFWMVFLWGNAVLTSKFCSIFIQLISKTCFVAFNIHARWFIKPQCIVQVLSLLYFSKTYPQYIMKIYWFGNVWMVLLQLSTLDSLGVYWLPNAPLLSRASFSKEEMLSCLIQQIASQEHTPQGMKYSKFSHQVLSQIFNQYNIFIE